MQLSTSNVQQHWNITSQIAQRIRGATNFLTELDQRTRVSIITLACIPQPVGDGYVSIQIRLPAKRKRLVGSVKKQLLAQAQGAALCAIKVFNDPLVKFKSEAFIVLMVIAWTYLLHAYYRSKRIDYCYFQKPMKKKVYDKTKSGARKHWELERCLNDEVCPIDQITQKNLRFLIGLRHEIEHHMSSHVDDYLSARYQACTINFNDF